MGTLLARFRSRIPQSAKRWARYFYEYPGFWLRVRANYAYDRIRFTKWSSADGRAVRRVQLSAWINADYHKIEKALALRSPRPGFGAAVVRRLLENLEKYLRIYGTDDVCDIAISALTEYVQFNKLHGSLDPLLDERIRRLSENEFPGCGSSRRGGTELVHRDDILRAAQMDLTCFFESRHSVRQFSSEPVPEEMLERAILMARNSPSVCNRQSFRVYAYSDPDQRKRVLKCQKGNAGFGEEIPLALIVSCDLQTFFSVGERNQCWIDGGLFSMSLVYALHSLGLGTICLNWCAEKDLDRELHLVAGIPESEVIIMLIGAGFLPATLRVAQSPRRSLDKVLVWGHKGKTT